MFKHPNYYKELRKLRNNLDQTISNSQATADDSVRSGPGLKLNPKPAFVIKGTSSKRQASSRVGSKAFKIIKP